MAIPQINTEQEQTMRDLCGVIPAFSQVVPVEEKDGKERYEAAMEGIRDTEQLVILGLLKEVTSEQSDRVTQAFAVTGRLFRVFEITDVGRAMFSTPDRTVQ